MSDRSFQRYLTQSPAHGLVDAGAQVLNVMHTAFAGGARGDGLVDDRPAIQAALDAAAAIEPGTSPGTAGGGIVYLPAQSTYRIGKPSSGFSALAPSSNVAIIGGGPSTVLKLDDAASNGTTMDLLGIGNGTLGAVSNVYVDNLTLDGNATNQTGTSRVILLNGCVDVWIGPNVRIVNPKTRSMAAANSPQRVTVGAVRGEIDARVVGVQADAIICTTAAMTSGSNVLTGTGFSAALNGKYCSVEQAGAADTNAALTPPGVTGYRNLEGYFKYTTNSNGTGGTVFSDSALTTPLNASNTVSNVRARIGTDDTSRLADAIGMAGGTGSLGGCIVRLPDSVLISGQQILNSGVCVRGHGAGVTYVVAKTGNSVFTAHTAANIDIAAMTIDGYGPDGGADGTTFQTNVALFDVQQILLEDLTLRHAHVGLSINNQTSDDISIRRVRCEDILTSNGTYGNAQATGAIGAWIFNGPKRVKIEDFTADGIDRHGLYFDPGNAIDTAADQHGFIDGPVGANIQVHNAARCGIGVGVGLQGVRYGSFSNIVIDTVGYRSDNVSPGWNDCVALYMGGDQNGEYTAYTRVAGLVVKDAGGKALHIEGPGNHIQGSVFGFNKADSASSVAPVYIDSYPYFTAHASGITLQGPDLSNNLVELDVKYLDAGAHGYQYAAVIVGGTAVPDGLGAAGSRTAQALGNRITGRFVRQGRKYTDGVTHGADVSGKTTFTSATAIFCPEDVGKTIMILDDGGAGVKFLTTIAARASSTSITLASAPAASETGKTFFVGYSAPSAGLLSLWGGSTDCPSEGPNANVCTNIGVADQASSQVEHVALANEAFSRYRRLASGQMDWGGGTSTYDVTLNRVSAGVLRVSTGQLSARNQLATYGANGALVVVPHIAMLTKAGVDAMTLAAPASPADNGLELEVIAATANAHTVTLGSGTFNAGGATTIATFGGAVGDTLALVALNGSWYVKSGTKNIAFS